MTPKLEIRGLSYSYHSLEGETRALSDISFQVNPGEFLAVIGPSGCGKSTLLSLLCGLAEPEEGTILLDGKPLSQSKHRIGYMLQKDHLFEWRSILSNVSLGLEIRKCLTPQRLEELSSRRQMIVITHWPRLAMNAQSHFRVLKEEKGDETFTWCKKLTEQERKRELARMSGREEAAQS